ncbi:MULTISPECIES: RDD family protein [unclassified Modicisalibacter]|uniref:RDD family protein n=1 Tax=unclassified Modicisalibacter TaxID=2679913 RepID=UPI001CC99FC6|nr:MULTISPECIES: RDD family protein [unclassified Modicisalibacter]MBZ9559520.1 RDD family protein [Modicisalibacter sp. R2A 31.J]MBZ9576972.1 RDD family protein [Modicisalibacter sp. MOD 31.J]
MPRRRCVPSDGRQPAGLARRLAAMGYDTLVLIALWMLVAFIGVAANGGEAVTGPLFRLILLLITLLFFVVCWRRGGMTLGMQAWGLRLETRDGRRPSIGQCLIRLGVAGVSLLALGLGHGWVLIDRERRSWADIASGTRVVVQPRRRQD